VTGAELSFEHIHELEACSDALHRRVRAFARGAAGTGSFDELALDIARFQYRYSPGFARLLDARGWELDSVEHIVPVPTDAFRFGRVAVYPPELDAVRFETSGTTASTRGVHVMRTTRTYEELSIRAASRALFADGATRATVIALAPAPGSTPASSLGFMMRHFMRVFDGRALSVEPQDAHFDAEAPGRWLVSAQGIDVPRLRRAVLTASERHDALLVLATSLALLLLLDELAGKVLPTPRRTVLMHTGGSKGRTREMAPGELRKAVAHAFRIPPTHVVGEYGMTELTSQLYEGCLPGGSLRGEVGLFVEPPWLRVIPVEPATLAPLPDGTPGLAKILDLGNIDSAVAVLTQDVVCRRRGGIQLLGRAVAAPPRGCSLSIENMVLGGLGADEAS
jgi:hypothetical protein